MTPARLPSRSRGRADLRLGETAASGRCTIAMTPTRSRPFSRASARSWMSRIANCARPPSSSLARRSRTTAPATLQRRRPRRRRSRAPARGRCRRATALGWKSSSERGRLVRAVLPAPCAAAGRDERARRARAAARSAASGPSARAAWQPPPRAGAAAPVGSSGCGAASPSRATSRSRSRGRAAATASTARSRRTGRTCTSPTRSSALLDGAARRGVKELLVLTGEAPDHHPGVRERLARARASRTSSPTSCGPASGRSSAGCCRTRTSACSRATTSRACAR